MEDAREVKKKGKANDEEKKTYQEMKSHEAKEARDLRAQPKSNALPLDAEPAPLD